MLNFEKKIQNTANAFKRETWSNNYNYKNGSTFNDKINRT